MSHARPKKSRPAQIPILTDASGYGIWKTQIESNLYRCSHKASDIDTLKSTSTLDPKFYKSFFKKEFAENAVDDNGEK